MAAFTYPPATAKDMDTVAKQFAALVAAAAPRCGFVGGQAGTWDVKGDVLTVTVTDDVGKLHALAGEVSRLGAPDGYKVTAEVDGSALKVTLSP